MRKKMPRTMMSLLCAFLMLFVTACVPTKPTNTTVTTTFDNSNTTTTYPSISIETTDPPTQETTQNSKTTTTTTTSQSTTSKPTIYVTYPQKQKRFTSLDEYCQFVKTVDEQELRSIFTMQNSDGSGYFDKKTFEIILQDQQYFLPVIPVGYTFKYIRLATIDALLISFEQDNIEYCIFCFMSKEEKMTYMQENESFLKSDGTKVVVEYSPIDDGGGTCYWEESGYQCFAWFKKENKKQMWDLIKAFELKIMPIE